MTMQYKKVLVAVDGSKEAEWALKKAIEVCKRNQAELVIGHVIDTRNYPTLEAYDMTIRYKPSAINWTCKTLLR